MKLRFQLFISTHSQRKPNIQKAKRPKYCLVITLAWNYRARFIVSSFERKNLDIKRNSCSPERKESFLYEEAKKIPTSWAQQNINTEISYYTHEAVLTCRWTQRAERGVKRCSHDDTMRWHWWAGISVKKMCKVRCSWRGAWKRSRRCTRLPRTRLRFRCDKTVAGLNIMHRVGTERARLMSS